MTLLTVPEVALLLKVSPGSVRRLRKAGRLVAVNVGAGQQRHSWRFAPAEVERFLAATESPEAPQSRRSRKREKVKEWV